MLTTFNSLVVSNPTMKARKSIQAIVLGMLSLGLWGCGEDNLPLDENCIEARLVAELCGQAVIQVVNAEGQNLNLGTFEHWENGTFDNVFGTFLDCEDMGVLPQDGSTFRIRIVEDPREMHCAVCFALLGGMPEQQYHMRVVNDCSSGLGE